MTTLERLIQDDDGHWFLCPAHRYREATEMIDAFYALDGDAPLPNFIQRINNPCDLIIEVDRIASDIEYP